LPYSHQPSNKNQCKLPERNEISFKKNQRIYCSGLYGNLLKLVKLTAQVEKIFQNIFDTDLIYKSIQTPCSIKIGRSDWWKDIITDKYFRHSSLHTSNQLL